MEFTVGSRLDDLPIKQTANSWRHTKNMLFKQGFKSPSVEPGFDYATTTVDGVSQDHYNNGLRIIGRIPTPNKCIFFLRDNNTDYCEIGIEDKDGNYVKIITGLNAPNPDLLGFKLDCPIEGVYKYNYKKELIIAWCDGTYDTSSRPKILNLDRLPFTLNFDKSLVNPLLINLINLFPDCTTPNFELIESYNGGGNIQSGAIYFSVSYEIDDIDLINPIGISRPIIVASDSLDEYTSPDGVVIATTNLVNGPKLISYNRANPGEFTNKSFKINITNLDIRFKYFRLLVARKVAGVFTFNEVAKLHIPNTGELLYTYTGTHTLNDVSSDTFLIPNAIYDKVKSLTVLNDELIFGNVTQNNINYQKYANAIQVEWITANIATDRIETTFANPTVIFNLKGLTPEDVYGLYIGFHLKNGSVSPAFHIPGRPMSTINIPETTIDPAVFYSGWVQVGNNVSLTTTNVGLTALFLQYGLSLAAGWVLSIDFGGNVYVLDNIVLNGLVVDFNLTYIGVFPEAAIGSFLFKINAQTKPENELMATFPPILTSAEEQSINPSLRYFHTRDTAEVANRMGYWENETEFYPDTDDFDIWDGSGLIGTLREEKVRHHKAPGYETLYSVGGTPNLAIGIKFNNIFIPTNIYDQVDSIYFAFSLKGNNLGSTLVYGMSPAHIHNAGDFYTRVFDFGLLTLKPAVNPRYLRYYYETDSSSIVGAFPLITAAFQTVVGNQFQPEDNTAVTPDNGDNPEAFTLQHNSASLFGVIDTATDWKVCGICAFCPNVYEPFYEQQIAHTGIIYKVTSNYMTNIQTFGFDTYVNLFTCIWVNAGGLPADIYTPRAYHYSKLNIALRGLDRYSFNECGFGFINLYNMDLNSVINIKTGFCFNPYNTYFDKMPYRISRSLPNQSETIKIGWRNFPIGRYYEMPKDKGEIWKVQATDDVLIICHEYTTYTAMRKDRLDLAISEVFISPGDIFDRPPNDIMPIPEGYAGCQSQWGNVVCKLGFVFADRKQGKIFILSNNKIEEISKKGYRNFFKDNLNTSQDVDNPFTSVGITMAYDESNDRLIVSKKDVDVSTFSYKVFNIVGENNYGFYSLVITVDGSPPVPYIIYENLDNNISTFLSSCRNYLDTFFNNIINASYTLINNTIYVYNNLNSITIFSIKVTNFRFIPVQNFYSQYISNTNIGRQIIVEDNNSDLFCTFVDRTTNKPILYNVTLYDEVLVAVLSFSDVNDINVVHLVNGYSEVFPIRRFSGVLSDKYLEEFSPTVLTANTSLAINITSAFTITFTRVGANQSFFILFDNNTLNLKSYTNITGVLTLVSTIVLVELVTDIIPDIDFSGILVCLPSEIQKYNIELDGTLTYITSYFPSGNVLQFKSIVFAGTNNELYASCLTAFITNSICRINRNTGFVDLEIETGYSVTSINEVGYIATYPYTANNLNYNVLTLSDSINTGFFAVRIEDFKILSKKFCIPDFKTVDSYYTSKAAVNNTDLYRLYMIMKDNVGNLYPIGIYHTLDVYEDLGKIYYPNKSFTMSYYPSLNNNTGGWFGEHDYLPDVMFNNRNGLYSSKFIGGQTRLYKHNSNTKIARYHDELNTIQPIKTSYIELCFNLEETISKIFESITWLSNAYTINNYNDNKKDNTFDALIVYGDSQCSGEVSIVKNPLIWFSQGAVNIEEQWNFNDFFDAVINANAAFMDNNFALILSNINSNKSWYKKNLFIKKFVIVRFISYNTNQYELFLHDATVNASKSLR